jgi:hypothetical protein
MTTLDGMRIRPATPDDLPAINDVHLACGRPPWNGPMAADHQERLVVVALADEENCASIRMHAGLGFQEIGRHPTLLGARANREDLVLFRADRLA